MPTVTFGVYINDPEYLRFMDDKDAIRKKVTALVKYQVSKEE